MAACSASPSPPTHEADRPTRIVSLDLCADQFVLKFVEPARILGVSPDAVKDFSAMREAAIGLPVVRPLAEDVLVLKPDLVVRSYGGGPGAAEFFRRAGVPVLEVGWASDIDGVLTNVERMAQGLGAGEVGRAVAENARARLAAVGQDQDPATALYVTPAGVTTGTGTLIHEMILAAGLSNAETRAGWHPIPLERLAYERPDLMVMADFGRLTGSPDAWTPARHPVAQRQLSAGKSVVLPGAWTGCASWFLVDAVEAMAEGAP
jgi:iron complex transport system substrate-binding protein